MLDIIYYYQCIISVTLIDQEFVPYTRIDYPKKYITKCEKYINNTIHKIYVVLLNIVLV